MARWGMAVAAATLVAGAALVAGSSSVPPPAAGPTAGTTAAIRTGARVGYVNLPRLHREYRKAAMRAAELTAARKQAQEQLEALKAKYLTLQKQMQTDDPVAQDCSKCCHREHCGTRTKSH